VRTVRALGEALVAQGHSADVAAALGVLEASLGLDE